MTKDLSEKIQCALLHDINVCEDCKKCAGDNCAMIRLNLIDELKKEVKEDV